jgi:Mg-chelatase subunit ChlD
MLTRQRLVTYGIPTVAVATIALAATLTGRHASHDKKQATHTPSGARQVDVVFAVDTTGSMGGLIEGAKRTVWSIANHIRKTDPNASVRIGLVAYRDVTDDYVTRPFALTGDLDAVFAELSGYYAAGGGDTPEHVNAALDVALHRMAWREDAKKLVFLVGDAPPADRDGTPTFDVLAREAAEDHIVINAIRAGQDPETAEAFTTIASLAHGEFSTIAQDGGVQQIATPYDARLAELSDRIDATTIIAGDAGVRREYARKMEAAAEAPAPAKADRAAYFGSRGAKGRAAEDLVGGVATGTVSLDTVPAAALPAEYRDMDKATLQAEVQKRIAEREAAQTQIGELTKQRDAYLEEQAKNAPEYAFDAKVKEALEAQLK